MGTVKASGWCNITFTICKERINQYQSFSNSGFGCTLFTFTVINITEPEYNNTVPLYNVVLLYSTNAYISSVMEIKGIQLDCPSLNVIIFY